MLLISAVSAGSLMARKRGRPAKAGARYPCGKLKSGIEPIAPALWQRIASEAKKGALDERLGSELGRLFLHAELTSPQIAAGFRVAETYGAFERYKGKRRSTASPSYEASSRGDHLVAEELVGPDAMAILEERIRAAEQKFKALQQWFSNEMIPRGVCNALEELCVEDRNISWIILPRVRETLDKLGLFFGFTTARNAAKHAVIARKPTLEQDRTIARKPNLDRIYWMEVVRSVSRPDITDDELAAAYEEQRARVAREIFRRSKAKRSDNVIEFRKL